MTMIVITLKPWVTVVQSAAPARKSMKSTMTVAARRLNSAIIINLGTSPAVTIIITTRMRMSVRTNALAKRKSLLSRPKLMKLKLSKPT